MVDRAPATPTSASTADGETREIQSYMVFGTTFDVDANYTVVDAVGQGAYGIVWCVPPPAATDRHVRHRRPAGRARRMRRPVPSQQR